MLGDAAVLRTNATYADLLDHIADRQVYIPHGDRDIIIGTGGQRKKNQAQDEIEYSKEFDKPIAPIVHEPTTPEIKEALPSIPNVAQAIFTPSQRLQRLWRRSIISEVRQSDGSVFGLDFDEAKYHLINFGRANFDKEISVKGIQFRPDDRVKAYAYTNARQHLMSLVGLLPAAMADMYHLAGPGPWQVIDVGCGPGTGLLAINELMTEWGGILQEVQYHGIDVSKAMLELAANLTQEIHIGRSGTIPGPN